ncbi:hypothetical protein ACSYAY_09325 [Leptospirillum ferriphilum]|jgi:hypothetical protein|nr:hypothetical protein [Leptospirillum ferriphilum]AFS54055.1 hypothetical protein LFML04_1855 [Leptospirillum ferriphilum ML-04]EDZ38109.1 MAG: Hypothetical protein CGL2_11390046 [Leptospirillum sp. Group II '5-way CG']
MIFFRIFRQWIQMLHGGKVLAILFLASPAGCLGGQVGVSNPGFLVVVNKSSSIGTGTQGLLEYILPLSDGQSPLVTRNAHGTYAGGVVAQTFLFVFGTTSQGDQALWTYTLPLSKSATPTARTGFAGTPVAALSIANGQFVVFLEETSAGGCLEGFTFSALVSDTGPTLPAPTLSCTAGNLSLSGALTGGGLQLSGDGSDVFVEASTSSQSSPEEITLSAGTLASGSLGTETHQTLSELGSLSLPFQGITESSTLLLLPDPATPAVLFYTDTGLTSGSNAFLSQNSLNISPPVNLLALDPFGTFLYAAFTSSSSTPSSTPSLASFELKSVNNGSGTSPIATTGEGLDPVGLLTFTASQG